MTSVAFLPCSSQVNGTLLSLTYQPTIPFDSSFRTLRNIKPVRSSFRFLVLVYFYFLNFPHMFVTVMKLLAYIGSIKNIVRPPDPNNCPPRIFGAVYFHECSKSFALASWCFGSDLLLLPMGCARYSWWFLWFHLDFLIQLITKKVLCDKEVSLVTDHAIFGVIGPT